MKNRKAFVPKSPCFCGWGSPAQWDSWYFPCVPGLCPAIAACPAAHTAIAPAPPIRWLNCSWFCREEKSDRSGNGYSCSHSRLGWISQILPHKQYSANIHQGICAFCGALGEQSIWESADGQAYLLSPKTSDAEYADDTAYFCVDEVWHPFQMNMTYGNTLALENETGDVQFEGDFSIENGIFTVKDLQVTGEDSDLPKCDTYVFSEVENYDGQMSHFPFDS